MGFEGLLRLIPSIDDVMKRDWAKSFIERSSRSFVKRSLSEFFDSLRERVKKGDVDGIDDEFIEQEFSKFFERRISSSIRRVINATGVIVHTNLGRSPLSERAIEAIKEKASSYSNLEYDLEEGKRGIRYSHVRDLITELTGCEDAIVVNNNAAAVLLVLAALFKGKKVLVSRGELIEIGGSFRIPEVMEQSGCELLEVGTTNRTHLYDYERAIDEGVGAILKVHKSNYSIVGFTSEVGVKELSDLSKKYNIPLIVDLGSGALVDLSELGVSPPEPVVKDVLKDGADIVTISGDKVLGGPQAGIIMGKKSFIDVIKTHPLNRALRIDKLTLIALEETLKSYLLGREKEEIPVFRMISIPYGNLLRRSRRLAKRIKQVVGDKAEVGVVDGISKVGGGALPLSDIKTPVVRIRPLSISTEKFERLLRGCNPPVVSVVRDDAVLFNLRTVFPKEDGEIVRAVSEVLSGK